MALSPQSRCSPLKYRKRCWVMEESETEESSVALPDWLRWTGPLYRAEPAFLVGLEFPPAAPLAARLTCRTYSQQWLASNSLAEQALGLSLRRTFPSACRARWHIPC